MMAIEGVSYSLGPKRPYRPNEAIERRILAAARSVDRSLSVQIYSGRQDAEHQFGSPRHNTGDTVDFYIIRDGQRVPTSDPVHAQVVGALPAHGVNEIGVGMAHGGIHAGFGTPTRAPAMWGYPGGKSAALSKYPEHVRAVQATLGIAADGIYGGETRSALAQVDTSSDTTPRVASIPPPRAKPDALDELRKAAAAGDMAGMKAWAARVPDRQAGEAFDIVASSGLVKAGTDTLTPADRAVPWQGGVGGPASPVRGGISHPTTRASARIADLPAPGRTTLPISFSPIETDRPAGVSDLAQRRGGATIVPPPAPLSALMPGYESTFIDRDVRSGPQQTVLNKREPGVSRTIPATTSTVARVGADVNTTARVAAVSPPVRTATRASAGASGRASATYSPAPPPIEYSYVRPPTMDSSGSPHPGIQPYTPPAPRTAGARDAAEGVTTLTTGVTSLAAPPPAVRGGTTHPTTRGAFEDATALERTLAEPTSATAGTTVSGSLATPPTPKPTEYLGASSDEEVVSVPPPVAAAIVNQALTETPKVGAQPEAVATTLNLAAPVPIGPPIAPRLSVPPPSPFAPSEPTGGRPTAARERTGGDPYGRGRTAPEGRRYTSATTNTTTGRDDRPSGGRAEHDDSVSASARQHNKVNERNKTTRGNTGFNR